MYIYIDISKVHKGKVLKSKTSFKYAPDEQRFNVQCLYMLLYLRSYQKVQKQLTLPMLYNMALEK